MHRHDIRPVCINQHATIQEKHDQNDNLLLREALFPSGSEEKLMSSFFSFAK